jgi:hypothetical protein
LKDKDKLSSGAFGPKTADSGQLTFAFWGEQNQSFARRAGTTFLGRCEW